MPASAAPMATQLRGATRSPISSQPSSPAMTGALDWMNMMLATEVRLSAMMKQLEAVAKQRPSTTPGQPSSRNVATSRPRFLNQA
jgi:hypothetical protein